MLSISDLRTPLIGPINLTIRPGECVAVLGPSGSGKSLLLRAIADLDPNRGKVSFRGDKRSEMDAHHWRQKIALIPAESGWWADHVRQHFKATPDPVELLKAIDLPQALDWEVSRLSTGERHRLAIARALQMSPDILLLDEPTASLDVQATDKIEKLIEQQKSRGVAILLVTHNPDQANRLASKFLTMNSGTLTPTKRIEEVTDQ